MPPNPGPATAGWPSPSRHEPPWLEGSLHNPYVDRQISTVLLRTEANDQTGMDNTRQKSTSQEPSDIGEEATNWISEEDMAEAYRQHAGPLLAFARNLLSNGALAEEVVQEVFVRLWTRPQSFDPARGALRSYLLTQTRWRCVDLIRAEESRRQRERRASAEIEPRVLPDAEDQQAEAEKRRALAAMAAGLVELPLDERLPIDLAFQGELTYKEVAEILGWPEGTVKSRIRRGLHRMRDGMVADRAVPA